MRTKWAAIWAGMQLTSDKAGMRKLSTPASTAFLPHALNYILLTVPVLLALTATAEAVPA